MTIDPEIYERAAGIIDARGWAQGEYRKPKPSSAVCTVGAINVALTGRTTLEGAPAEVCALRDHALRALRAHLRGSLITVWNDKRNRTQVEVTSTLRACAAALRGEAT